MCVTGIGTLMDWKVVAAAPLVIENQLPSTYLIWETFKVSLVYEACKACCMCKLTVFTA